MARHAEIAGAGFAGLAAAAALCQRGWTVRVHEKNAELRAFGAGIFIWENGLRVLQAIGAHAAVVDGAFAAPRYDSRTNGETLVSQPINCEGGYRLLTMSRQHLYAAILGAARRSGAEIVAGSEAMGAAPSGALLMADGRRQAADIVIGADGVRSAVRDSLGLDVQRRRYEDGIIRVLCDRATLKGGVWDHVIDFWRTGDRLLRILYTPSGPDLLYMAMMAPAMDSQAAGVPVKPSPWIEAFPELEPVLTRLGDRGRYDVYETTKLDRWSVGRVAILGDAAHAMPPTLAQGAGCAITNALGLAVALDETDSVEAALSLWEERERPLTDHTQRRAAEIAASRALASGMAWDDEGLRAARHIPTGTTPAGASQAVPNV